MRAFARQMTERAKAVAAAGAVAAFWLAVWMLVAAVNRFPLIQKLEEPVEKGCLIVIVPMSYENHMKIRKLKSFMILG